MIASVEPINSGFVITDPEDPRYQYLLGVKHRFGRFLHSASVSLRQQGEENTVDAVQMLVCLFHPALSPTCTQHVQVKSVRTYMLEYGDSRDKYVPFVYYFWWKRMNCDTAILITKNNIRMTRVLPASMGVKKSGLEPSTFAVLGLYFLPLCRAHPLTSRSDIIMQHAYAGTALNVKGVK